MANGKKQGADLVKTDAVIDGSAALAKVRQGDVDADDAILDGDAVIKSLMGAEEGPKATVVKVVKLKNTPERRTPAIRGVFLGYEPIMVTPPTGGEPRLMNFVLLRVSDGFIVKHLGTSQIMQGIAIAQIGDVVTIVKPDVADIEIAGGRRVKVFHVLIDRSAKRETVGYAKPFGEWGQRMAMAGNTRPSLPAGDAAEVEEGFDPETGAEKPPAA